jgi:hypothetical protein
VPQTNQKATHTIRFYIGDAVFSEHQSAAPPERMSNGGYSGIHFIDLDTGKHVFMADKGRYEVIAHDTDAARKGETPAAPDVMREIERVRAAKKDMIALADEQTGSNGLPTYSELVKALEGLLALDLEDGEAVRRAYGHMQKLA